MEKKNEVKQFLKDNKDLIIGGTLIVAGSSLLIFCGSKQAERMFEKVYVGGIQEGLTANSINTAKWIKEFFPDLGDQIVERSKDLTEEQLHKTYSYVLKGWSYYL